MAESVWQIIRIGKDYIDDLALSLDRSNQFLKVANSFSVFLRTPDVTVNLAVDGIERHSLSLMHTLHFKSFLERDESN